MNFFKSGRLAAIILYAMVACPGAAEASIAIGANSAGTWAWTFGSSACDKVFLAGPDANPCGRPFTLADQAGAGTFEIEGCGGPMWATLNGEFDTNCRAFSGSGCGITIIDLC
ncbi:hypothetical protein FB451DRAFT_1531917 [Mycena latifolia]|nr:hypothetical protein FB451DRAFT_1531917 [Mycena latifolia]